MIDAVALNAHHLLAEKAAQIVRVARRVKASAALARHRRPGATSSSSSGMADQLIGEVLAVFEDVDGAARQFGVVARACEPDADWPTTFSRNDSKLSSSAAGRYGRSDSRRSIAPVRSAQIEIAAQIGGGKLGARRRGLHGGSGSSLSRLVRDAGAAAGPLTRRSAAASGSRDRKDPARW